MKFNLNFLLDWIYPPVCVACGQIIALNDTQPRQMLMCKPCQAVFEPMLPPICNFCGMPTERSVERCASCYGKHFTFASNRATFMYEDLLRDLLLKLKFSRDKRIAHSLGQLWANHICTHFSYNAIKNCDTANTYLVPLPMHPKKQRERGFCQANVITTHIATKTGIPMQQALVRVIDTPPQSGLHPRQRIENVNGAFAIPPNISPSGKNYIIIDDIYTTGASLNACASTLLSAGAKNVSCLTLAIVKRKTKDDDED